MGLEVPGQRPPHVPTSGSGRLAVTLVFGALALLHLAPLLSWGEASGTMGGLWAWAIRSLRLIFDFSGATAGWKRVGALVFLMMALGGIGRLLAGLAVSSDALMAETATPEGSRRAWQSLIRRSYMVLIPILALTYESWRDPLREFLEQGWAVSYLERSATVSGWRFGLAVQRVLPFLLLIASLASVMSFTALAGEIRELRRFSPAAFQPGSKNPVELSRSWWEMLGGVAGALLARDIFAPDVQRRLSSFTVLLVSLHLSPLAIVLLMTAVERSARNEPLSDGEPSDAVRATEIVSGLRGDPATVELLAPKLHSEDLHVFARAANGLCWLGPKGGESVDEIFAALPARRSLAERELLLQTLDKVNPRWSEGPDAAQFVPILMEHLSLNWMNDEDPAFNPFTGTQSLRAFVVYESTTAPIGIAYTMSEMDETPLADLMRAMFRAKPDWIVSPAGQAMGLELRKLEELRTDLPMYKRQAAADTLVALRLVIREHVEELSRE